MELVAWDLAGLEPPDALKQKAGIPLEKPKAASSGGKKWLRWVGLLAIAGGAAYALTLEEDADDLAEPPPPPPAPRMLFGGGR